ncbi:MULTISPECIES: secondary thiamine-phosphate synthase enzyme YjbQ [Shewanella]|jgi:secondary thiamine-phosphate synthase enzyme|uniref:secondary thiamine-phosphate synthase enzyme YjbQ n=1 Tax=Shewanella TaxID=22 RepID=UPI00200C3EDE|nr:secondary thiamine-phosphate synthase enzyme YjbQ [Shewanella basaltis]MCL1113488.1 secondary thiamine-phosphate synthase enzyme YjbQ [Shewanella basaltis]
MWMQKTISLASKKRGFHLITDEVLSQLPELKEINVGLLHVFIQHTSASLTINENADPTVRGDMERHFNVLAPEGAPYFKHTYEGLDDMPAHIKSTLIGVSQTIPITQGCLNLGIWQGLYLCEHRDNASCRTIIVTVHGE